MINIIAWLLSHPITVPVLCMAFLIGAVCGACFQFSEDDRHAENG